MKTGLFIIIVLISGCFAGLIHGGINLVIVEPYLDQAIEIENQTLFAMGVEEDTSAFWVEYNSYRVWQKGGQILAGAILGTSIAALVGIVFLFVRKTLPQGNNVKKTLILSGLMWFTIFVIPFLKYPANPPTVGESETVVMRGILFVSFIAISGLGAVAFYQVYKKLQNRKILAFAGYAVFISIVFFIMPENPDEITAPMELVDGFRSASFVAVSVYWLTLGLILGGFVEKLQERLNLTRS
jgi:predicted cobalt transporter CbtA